MAIFHSEEGMRHQAIGNSKRFFVFHYYLLPPYYCLASYV